MIQACTSVHPLNSTAALHTSAPCPSVMSSGKDSRPSRGGRSFFSKWLSKVYLTLETAGGRGEMLAVKPLFSPQAFPHSLLWPAAASAQVTCG